MQEELNVNHLKRINDEFDQTWMKLSTLSAKAQECETRRAVRKLHKCLKWTTAYTFIQSYCGEIIKKYSKQHGILIKKFWIEYVQQHLIEDIPPTPNDFFIWYCKSETILEERSLQL